MICFLLISVTLILQLTAASVPSYIKPCSISDPNFSKCCLESGKIAIKQLIIGDKELNIPPLDPLKLKRANLSKSKEINIIFENIVTHGLKELDLKTVMFANKEGNGFLDFDIPVLNGQGDYNMSGQLLLLPITGQGRFNLTAVNAKFHYQFESEKINIKGKHYFKITSDSIVMNPDKIDYHFTNLFNGDELLGTNLNRFLNENWKEVYQEVGGPFTNSVLELGRSVYSKIFKHSTYDELFLK